MAHVVILGGGFGGLSAATALRGRLPAEHRITVVDRSPEFVMGLRFLWILSGTATRQAGARPLASLGARGIEVRQAEILGIEPAARTVETSDGALRADFLVVALGAHLDPAAVPGFEGLNLYDVADVERAAARIADLREGRVVIGVLGAPYKCPSAPYEAAFLIDGALRARGVRDAVRLDVFTPQPMSLPVAGAAACSQVEGTLAVRRIGFHPSHKAARVEPGRVVFENGRDLEYDLLLAVPPHRCPRAVVEAGLTGGSPWVAPDPATLETAFERVYAIGDVTQIPIGNGQMLPKAGVFAEGHADAVATQVAAQIAGTAPAPYDGQGYCFLEMGGGVASFIRGNFYARPAPAVEVTPPSPEASARKREFEQERLARWFGA